MLRNYNFQPYYWCKECLSKINGSCIGTNGGYGYSILTNPVAISITIDFSAIAINGVLVITCRSISLDMFCGASPPVNISQRFPCVAPLNLNPIQQFFQITQLAHFCTSQPSISATIASISLRNWSILLTVVFSSAFSSAILIISRLSFAST